MLAIVVPGAIGVFNLLIMKTFFENMPVELEEAAKIAWLSRQLRSEIGSIGQELLDKHFLRKNGPGAYYGQK